MFWYYYLSAVVPSIEGHGDFILSLLQHHVALIIQLYFQVALSPKHGRSYKGVSSRVSRYPYVQQP